jgi:hypothetical protein
MVMLRLILITLRGIVHIKMINPISPYIYEFFGRQVIKRSL